MPRKDARLTIRIEHDLLLKAAEVANVEGESLSALIRRLLRNYVRSRRGEVQWTGIRPGTEAPG